MAFLDDFGKKLSTAADLAVDKAKDLAEIGKLKLDIAAEEKEINNLYILWKRKIRTVFMLQNAKILANGCNGLQNCRRKQNGKNCNVA